ncbi:MAG: sulfite exporter TauE/SafE family protein [Acidithiobacillales bacterium]
MPPIFGDVFVPITWTTAILVVLLGFIGGVLSGFIGSGGAFFMTPGMMNLGVSGVVAVGSNITHKFGKALVGARKHAQMGNVDKRLAMYLLVTALIGIRLAVWINSLLFAEGGSHGTARSAGSDLYISAIFICVLTFVAISMLRDALRPASEGQGPSRAITDFLARLNLKPIIKFPVSDVELSLWVLLPVGLATGYLAGTIGVGGFVGVPAMIYIFGIPTAVAAGTELYLAIFMGAFGALNYAFEGYVDLRMTCLLFLGSLVGVYIGVYGVKVLSERVIRLSTGFIILLCVISRAIAVPVYLRQLGWVAFDPAWDRWLNGGSTVMLFAAGIGGAGMILVKVAKAHIERQRIHTTLLVRRPVEG